MDDHSIGANVLDGEFERFMYPQAACIKDRETGFMMSASGCMNNSPCVLNTENIRELVSGFSFDCIEEFDFSF